MKSKVIAIDGHTGTGKGEAARRLSEILGLPALDTGWFYRAAAYVWNGSEAELGRISFNEGKLLIDGVIATDSMLRTSAMGTLAAKVAAIPEIRQQLLPIIRACVTDKGLIADGRDMGSVVFPEAALKIFLTADASVRARRVIEDPLRGKKDAPFPEVLADTLYRDHLDETRKDAPLIRASDAILLDTSHLDRQEVAETIARLWKLVTEK